MIPSPDTPAGIEATSTAEGGQIFGRKFHVMMNGIPEQLMNRKISNSPLAVEKALLREVLHLLPPCNRV